MPMSFWYLSVVGSVMTLCYFICKARNPPRSASSRMRSDVRVGVQIAHVHPGAATTSLRWSARRSRGKLIPSSGSGASNDPPEEEPRTERLHAMFDCGVELVP